MLNEVVRDSGMHFGSTEG